MGAGTVIVGGGIGSLRLAETLRSLGYREPIRIVSDEPHLPYDRPVLSKGVLVGSRAPSTATYRDRAFFEEQGIAVSLEEMAIGLDVDAKLLETTTNTIGYEHLVVATGTRAREVPDLAAWRGVHLLRSLDDAVRVRARLDRAQRIAVVGAGFIGCEVASSARTLGVEVTMIEAADHPLSRVLGARAGEFVVRMHEEDGTEVRCGIKIERVDGDQQVERLVLSDGSTVEADLVLVGVGAVPNTEWLRETPLAIDNGVVCDAGLRAGQPNIFAIGDVARWPNDLLGGELMRCEQWTNAVDQARYVAKVIAGAAEDQGRFESSCYFWSDQCGTKVQSVGRTAGVDEAVLLEDPAQRQLVLAYGDGSRIVGAVAIGQPRALMRLKGLVEQRAAWESVGTGVLT